MTLAVEVIAICEKEGSASLPSEQWEYLAALQDQPKVET